jgi:hypothetical protein
VSTEPAKVLRLPLRPGSLGGRTLFLRWVVLQAVVATLIAGAAIAYGDQVPAFAAIDFLSCLLVVFVAVALTSSPPQVKTYGDYAVVITWPKGQNDVDSTSGTRQERPPTSRSRRWLRCSSSTTTWERRRPATAA